MIRIVIGQHCIPGIFGATILGLGRALGETMAVTMVIGNRPDIVLSLFQPGYSMAAPARVPAPARKTAGLYEEAPALR